VNKAEILGNKTRRPAKWMKEDLKVMTLKKSERFQHGMANRLHERTLKKASLAFHGRMTSFESITASLTGSQIAKYKQSSFPKM
jgi:hypothetical protein